MNLRGSRDFLFNSLIYKQKLESLALCKARNTCKSAKKNKFQTNGWMDGWMDGLMDRKRARWMDGWIEKHTLIVLAHDLMCMGEGANWPPPVSFVDDF